MKCINCGSDLTWGLRHEYKGEYYCPNCFLHIPKSAEDLS